MSIFNDKISNLNLLRKISEEELDNHKDALRKKLLKPIQRLNDEVQVHFSKISRFAPELLDQSESDECISELPWNTKLQLAMAIKELTQADILKAWVTVVSGKYRSRIVSHTYGSSFGLDEARKEYLSTLKSDKSGRSVVHIVSTNDLFEKRKVMSPFGIKSRRNSSTLSTMVKQIGQKKLAIGVAAGTSLLLYAFNTMWSRKQGSNKSIQQK
jgi:hypothetical protein